LISRYKSSDNVLLAGRLNVLLFCFCSTSQFDKIAQNNKVTVELYPPSLYIN